MRRTAFSSNLEGTAILFLSTKRIRRARSTHSAANPKAAPLPTTMPSTAGADVKTAAEAMNGKYQSSIVIDGLRIMARHGVWPQETTVGNMFEVSVKLDFDAAGAMMADNFGLTVSYAEVIELIKQEMSVPSKLLENAVRRKQCIGAIIATSQQ